MNVAARLCEHCKAIDRRLVASGDALRLMTTPTSLVIRDGKSIAVRGRQERVEIHLINRARERMRKPAPTIALVQ